ncbi:astacin-like metalloendopeptidase [Lissotriton helveticus]
MGLWVLKAGVTLLACAQSYSTSPGTVTSENYPQNYPASLDCGYYISAPSGKKISLTFTDFDLEPSMPTCRADKLVIFNGRTIKDPLIGRYCGSGPVLSVVSSGNSLLLQFHSDSSDQMKGFQATYTFECFPENLELQQKQAKLTTNYHRSYSEIIGTYPKNTFFKPFVLQVLFENPETDYDADRPPAAESLDVFAAESLDVFEIICKENVESKKLLQGGDIAVKLGRSAMICKDDSCFWPKSSEGTVNVPYTLSGYSDSEVASITDAISEFAGLTCIRFVDRTTETDYLQIAPGDGCWSFMGRAGGPQPLSLIGGCLSRGSIQHELNHALGFHHEQSRSDRDEYVMIMTENISDGNLANFNKENTNNLGLEYDYSSIMHYGRYAFTKTTGQATIVPIKNPDAEIGQTVGLSNLDLAKINHLYNCDMYSTISRVGFGFLSSTNCPSQYPSNTDCSYLIRANIAKILLTFTAFDIESSPNCESDYVMVYDGMTKDSPVLLDKACGRGSVPPVVSSRNVMLLQFVTNGANSASGFNAYYQNIVCAQSYSTSPGTVTSENYPENYPASLDCGYYISAPSGMKITLEFTDFDLEPSMPICRSDKLIIYNGLTNKDPLIGRYCGSGPVQSVVSSGNSLLLQFHSDSSVQKKGFQATYTFGKLRRAK